MLTQDVQVFDAHDSNQQDNVVIILYNLHTLSLNVDNFFYKL